MSDKDKSKAQLISELRELRRQLKSQQAMVSSDSGDSAKEHDELTSDLRQSRKELSDSRAETKISNKALAESRETSRTSEQNLADVHERYNILGDLIPFGIWTADARGAVTFLSDVFLEMSGIPLEETARFNWLDQLTQPTVLKAISDWSGSLYERDIWEGEFKITSQEGRQYDILIRGVPLLDKEGEILSWLGINLDISKRKRADEQIRFQADIIDNSPMIAAYHDTELNVVWVNRAYQKATGLSLEEVRGKKCYHIWNLSEPCRGCPVITAIETGESAAHELTPDNQDHWPETQGYWLSQAAPVRDEQGTVIGALEFTIDITERKRAEEMLKYSYDLLKYIVEHMRSAIAVHDRNLNYIYVSQQYLLEYKVKEKDIIGKHHYEVFPDLPQKWRDIHQKALAGEVLRAEEDPYFRADGSVEWTRWECRPWYESDGSVGGIIVYTEVITERKRAEEEREKLQAQLFQSQKMESVGMLAGGIAHDFNNLLHAMGGNLELLDMKIPDDHPGKKRIHTIQKSMDRAAQLVKKLLLFTRKADIQTQVLDLNLEIHDAAKLLERSIPKMVNIELILDENAWPINADPIQVEQVLLNLGTNAADVMPDGGRLIIETANAALDQDFIRTHTGAKPGKYVLMTVSDTGCGMDKETLQHVFEPFFTTKEVGKGTGLGLASAYGIVKAHEGYITCYSEPGQGTTFKIYWPAAEQVQTDHVEAESQEPDSLEGTETILIVDDDDQIRDLARELLEDKGYQALSAASGEQALEIFRDKAGDIDLVIMDLNMPGMGGRKCTKEMISIEPSVKVLVASGYSAVGHGKQASEYRAKDFISKPYQMREILAKIREVLDRDQR